MQASLQCMCTWAHGVMGSCTHIDRSLRTVTLSDWQRFHTLCPVCRPTPARSPSQSASVGGGRHSSFGLFLRPPALLSWSSWSSDRTAHWSFCKSDGATLCFYSTTLALSPLILFCSLLCRSSTTGTRPDLWPITERARLVTDDRLADDLPRKSRTDIPTVPGD